MLMLWKCFSESLTERVKSFRQSVSDLSLAAATSVTNLNRAVEHFTRIINRIEERTTSASLKRLQETVAGDETRTTTASSDETLLKQLHETVALLRRLAGSLESAKTDVSKRQARLKIPSTQHLTTGDGSVSQCQQARW